jgi:hypothetical protein
MHIAAHPNQFKQLAERLGLSVDKFLKLLSEANHAYDVIRDLGPFYSRQDREDIKDPTFRITAEPVLLPKDSKKLFEELGVDLLYLSRALPRLPLHYQEFLGDGLDFATPITWRVDAIFDEKGNIHINEIEGRDGSSALMVAEQFAYGLQTAKKTTITSFITALKRICPAFQANDSIKIALLRKDVAIDPVVANARRFCTFLELFSEGDIKADLYDEEQLQSGVFHPNWSKYGGIINESSLSTKSLKNLGIKQKQILSAGNYSAFTNKGVFAFLYEKSLQAFWQHEIGRDRLMRLKDIFLPSSFIESLEDIDHARKNGRVVKISWAGENIELVNRSRGVALPDGNGNHSSPDTWKAIQDLIKKDIRIIAQDFVKPAQIHAYLRKKGTTLEEVNWYNRVCVKYVVEGDPTGDIIPNVAMTAVEVTLGPDIVPAGRECAFTAGTFQI